MKKALALGTSAFGSIAVRLGFVLFLMGAMTAVAVVVGHMVFNDTVEEADSWIENDRLCYLWFHDSGDVTICNLVFRDTARGPGHYYMAADDGPHPFQLAD